MTTDKINNHIEGLPTTILTEIVQHCDEHTNTDEEFYKAFTEHIFERFNWMYYSKKNGVTMGIINGIKIHEEAQSQVDQRSFEDYQK